MQTKLASIFGLLLIILALRFFLFYQNQPKYHDGQQVSFHSTLLKEPQVFSRYQTLSANINSTQEIFISFPVFSQLHYGDTVVITGTLKERVLNKNKAILTMSYPKIEKVENNKNLILAISSFIRQKATLLFEKSLPAIQSSLLLGIVFGIKESLPKDFSDSLRISGVFHVIAASGMNVTFVGGFFSSLFAWFFKRQIAILLSVAAIFLYAVLAGLDPPIVRASIMATLVFTARILGRQTLATYGLFLAGFSMLVWLPNLIFDIGFQLSFLATLGLLYIQPILEGGRNLQGIIKNSILGEGVVTTVAAQASTLPILLSNFGLYSLWSIAANGLVLWTIPSLMVIGGLSALTGIVFPSVGQLVLYLALPFLLYFEKVIMFFGKMGGVVALENLPWQFAMSYYLLLCAAVLFFKKRNKF